MGWQKITQAEDLSQEAIKARKVERLRGTPHGELNQYDMADHVEYDHPTLIQDSLPDMHIDTIERLIRDFRNPDYKAYKGNIKNMIGRWLHLTGRSIGDAHADVHRDGADHTHPEG